MIDNKNKIIKIQNFEDILYVFFDNGKVLLIRDNDIYKVVDLKVKNIEFLYFQNNKLFASLDNAITDFLFARINRYAKIGIVLKF